MSDRPRVLIELGEELGDAARRELRDARPRRGGRSRPAWMPTVGSVIAVVALLAAVALAAVAILLVGHRHPAPAANGARRAAGAAPRGEILDRDGVPLVISRPVIDVQIVPGSLPVPLRDPTLRQLEAPPSADRAVYDRLAIALGISPRRRVCDLAGRTVMVPRVDCEVARTLDRLPNANVTVATGVSERVRYMLAEDRAKFPGVTEPSRYVSSYPYGGLAAQVLGYPGPGPVTGLEAYYDQYLRGRGPATPGDTLRTTLDLRLEQTGEASLERSISANAPPGAGGAFVAMDPRNGQVLAMGSYPTFNPNVFSKPISAATDTRLFGTGSGDPQANRAIDGQYPTGSTLKAITATAALESGVWSLGDTYRDTGQYCFSQLCLHNAGNVANGVLDLVSAIRVSDDVFFYNLGALLNVNPTDHPRGGALQQWARLYGIGQPTGIDLPSEASGVLPDPSWRAAVSQKELHHEHQHHVGCCTIGHLGPWTVGDNVNLAVGQGDVQVTPLQLAVAYAAIANGGTIVRPHLGLQIENGIAGTVLQNIDPPPARHLVINAAYLDAVRQGLRDAASAPGGTSADVMASFPEPVYGATGAAEHVGQPDQAWYACYVPATATSKPIVLIVTIEKGGFGDTAAAPVARQMLNQWFFAKPGPYIAGHSTTP